MRLSPTIKTIILFGALTSLLGVIGYLISGTGGALIFLFFGIFTNIFAYFFGDKIALMMSGARPLDKNEAPEVYEIVENLTQKMNLPLPKLYISENMQPNAFATGRGHSNSSVCVTKGLLQILNKEEIEGVLGHELTHVKNRDVLIATIAAVIAGAISSIAQIGIFFGGRDRDRSPFVDLLVLILAPISATLIQLAISRTREYEADAGSAKVTGNPKALANALIKIDQAARQIPMQGNPAFSSLYIENPFRGQNFIEIFSTHPATEKRVQRLMEMR